MILNQLSLVCVFFLSYNERRLFNFRVYTNFIDHIQYQDCGLQGVEFADNPMQQSKKRKKNKSVEVKQNEWLVRHGLLEEDELIEEDDPYVPKDYTNVFYNESDSSTSYLVTPPIYNSYSPPPVSTSGQGLQEQSSPYEHRYKGSSSYSSRKPYEKPRLGSSSYNRKDRKYRYSSSSESSDEFESSRECFEAQAVQSVSTPSRFSYDQSTGCWMSYNDGKGEWTPCSGSPRRKSEDNEDSERSPETDIFKASGSLSVGSCIAALRRMSEEQNSFSSGDRNRERRKRKQSIERFSDTQSSSGRSRKKDRFTSSSTERTRQRDRGRSRSRKRSHRRRRSQDSNSGFDSDSRGRDRPKRKSRERSSRDRRGSHEKRVSRSVRGDRDSMGKSADEEKRVSTSTPTYSENPEQQGESVSVKSEPAMFEISKKLKTENMSLDSCDTLESTAQPPALDMYHSQLLPSASETTSLAADASLQPVMDPMYPPIPAEYQQYPVEMQQYFMNQLVATGQAAPLDCYRDSRSRSGTPVMDELPTHDVPSMGAIPNQSQADLRTPMADTTDKDKAVAVLVTSSASAHPVSVADTPSPTSIAPRLSNPLVTDGVATEVLSPQFLQSAPATIADDTSTSKILGEKDGESDKEGEIFPDEKSAEANDMISDYPAFVDPANSEVTSPLDKEELNPSHLLTPSTVEVAVTETSEAGTQTTELSVDNEINLILELSEEPPSPLSDQVLSGIIIEYTTWLCETCFIIESFS